MLYTELGVAETGERFRGIQVILRWCVVLLLAFIGANPALAHPANEANIYHYLYLRVAKGEVSLQHATVVGGLVTARVWPTLDTDGDRTLSEAEQLHAARELAAGLTLRLDGKSLPLRLDSYEFPSHTEFFGSAFPAAKLLLTGSLPASAKGRLEVRDETYPHYQGVFPTPELRPTEVSAAVRSISEDGRMVVVALGEEAAAAQSSGMPPLPELSPPGAATPKDAVANRLPGLRLVPEGEALLGPRPEDTASPKQTTKPVPDAPPSLDVPTPDPKRIFPSDPKIVWAAPKDAVHSDAHAEHEEALGLRGLLGRRLGPLEILLGLLAALVAGAAHALEPGHGKSMVAAYLVGTRGTVKDAILLGIVVTLSHTAGVYVLGFLTLQLTHFIRAEVIGQWLSLTSGLLVLGMGFWLFQRGLLHYHGIRPMVGHGHSHSGGGHSHAPAPAPSHAQAHAGGGHTHAAHDNPTHSHDAPAPEAAASLSEGGRRPPHDSPVEEYARTEAAEGSAPGVGKWGILGLGLAGGIVPCYAALALLIAAINLGNVALGLGLIAVFSVGMASVLVAVGIVMVKARHWVGALNQESRWMQALPAVSGGVMLCLGIWLTFQALITAGVLRVGA